VLVRLVKLTPPAEGVLHVLFLVGVAMVASGSIRRRFPGLAIAMAATLAWMFHFFLSEPLLRTHFIPEYVRSMMWAFVLVLVAGVPVALALERLPRRVGSFVVLAALSAACAGLVLGARALAKEDLAVGARRPYPPQYQELARWVEGHAGANDVVLSSNELSFAWAALTGRKTLVTRRAQNDGFLDMDERNRDAALILYGRDDQLRRERLARWHVRWVLWTSDWVPTEYVAVDSTRISKVDPLLWFSDAERDSSAARAGVGLVHLNSWVDPAMQFPEIPRFELTLVGPQNYERPERPWRPALDALLEEAWSYEHDGRRLATLYRVRAR
jgi:hypothetical protein